MTSKQYINFPKKFDELASDIDDIRELLLEVLQYNQNIINKISKLNITIMTHIGEASTKGAKIKKKPKSWKIDKVIRDSE